MFPASVLDFTTTLRARAGAVRWRNGAFVLSVLLSVSIAAAAQLTVSWEDRSTTETGFEVQRTTDGVTFVRVATVPANTTSYVDTDVVEGRSYWYRVRAFNATDKSDFSNVTGGSVSQNGGAITSGRLMNLSARAVPTSGEGALFSGFVVSEPR